MDSAQISARHSGVIGTSRKESERRVPIHPGQLDWIPDEVRGQLRFEAGYGEPFDVSDEALAASTGGVADRGQGATGDGGADGAGRQPPTARSCCSSARICRCALGVLRTIRLPRFDEIDA